MGRRGFQEAERNSERFQGNIHKREIYGDRKPGAWDWERGEDGGVTARGFSFFLK